MQRRCQRPNGIDGREMVGRHRVLESGPFHAGQASGAAGRRSHQGGGRRYLQVPRRFSDRPDEKLQSQFNSDR